MLIGFIHGVMNTDHTYIAGETIDYGPCAFMTQPRCSARSTDPAATPIATNRALNLARFAETLLPLLAGGRGSGSCRMRWRQNRIARSLQLPVSLSKRTAAKDRIRLGARRRCRTGPGPAGRMAENGADCTLTLRRHCNAAAGAEMIRPYAHCSKISDCL